MTTLDCSTSSQPGENTHAAFDETAWRAICDQAATAALRGCGQSHDWYVELFSSAVEAQVQRLPEHQQAYALEIARDCGDYATPAERQETRDSNAEDGYCKHGIPIDCCPAGCGEL